MKIKHTLKSSISKKIKWALIFIFASACVERIYFDIHSKQPLMVVEGMISDQPGPYIVKVSQSLDLESDTSSLVPIKGLKIKLLDDIGNQEDLIESQKGTYSTTGIIQGKIGRTYRIRIENNNGSIFESIPEKILPTGEIEQIRFEFERRISVQSFGEVPVDVFNLFIDSKGIDRDSAFFRWRFKGTYKVFTEPMFNFIINPPYTPLKSPYPCSGYIVIEGPNFSGGLLKKVGECECCECWVNDFETYPQLSDQQLITNGRFRNIKVAEVSVNSSTFYDKYNVEIEQMSLSRKAFNFFKLVREQKVNSSSVFQPPSGEILGNIKPVNNFDPVVGIFWATATTKKDVFIYQTDLPYLITPIPYSTLPCNKAYKNSSTKKPLNW